MSDNRTPQERSYNMSQIKSGSTKPEETIRKFLFSMGLRYRKNDKRYPGKPDIVLPKYRTIIFINGCFWHCHDGCLDFVIPKSRQEYWAPKLQRNKQRDAEHIAKLIKSGWNVLTVWECELKKGGLDSRLERLLAEIVSCKTKADH